MNNVFRVPIFMNQIISMAGKHPPIPLSSSLLYPNPMIFFLHSYSTPPQNLSDDIPVSKTKSVRFEAVEEDENKLASGRFSISIDAPQKSSQLHLSSPNYSPGSTPLKLNEEMDTPGTVYPSKSKSTEIRCQFVHPLSKATVSQMVLSPELTVDGNSTTSYSGPKPDGEIEVQSDDMSPEMEKLWDGKGIPNSTKKYNEV